MTTIEQNIKAICRQKGMTLTDVANRIGSTPSNLLSSIKGNPSLSRLQSIADALFTPLSDIVADDAPRSLGHICINGKFFQITPIADDALEIPVYSKYDELRKAIKSFIAKAVKDDHPTSLMGMLEHRSVFCIFHDFEESRIHLSFCFGTGMTSSHTYDKMEYATWENSDTSRTSCWCIDDVVNDIMDDLVETTKD